jgi:hypothetical protein
MKFQMQVSDLNDALGVVTLVSPTVVTSQGASGYLFVVKDGKCSVHSRDEHRRVKVDVPVGSVEGDGSFIYPADKIASMEYLDGWIEFESGQDGDRHWVKYKSEGGAKAERSTCDPSLMQPLDEDLEKAAEGFDIQSALLREGLTLTRGYAAKAADNRLDDQYKTVQLFDAAAKKEWAKGDGCLYATDHIRMIYFICEAFKGRGLSIHGRHLPCLMSFLSKCSGKVTIRPGEGVTFLVDEKGQALGWSHHLKQHGKYNYYPLKLDNFVLNVPKLSLVKTLKLVRAELEARRDKIRIEYTHGDKSLRFKASETSGEAESNPVGAEPVIDEEKGTGKDGLTKDFAANINIDHMLDLVEPIKSHHMVELRVTVVKKENREYILLRTIERFWLDGDGKVLISDKDTKGEAFLCEVTRFMPSKD